MTTDSTVKQPSAFPRRDFASECCNSVSLLKDRGRRECRVHAAPTALRAKRKRRTQANTGTPKSLRHSLRNGFTAAPCSPRCTGLFSHRRLRRSSRRLDPQHRGTEPHGLTVRIAPHVLRPNASIATRLTSGDEWPSRPPCRGGLASLNHNFCLSERHIFLRGELDSSGKTGGGFFGSPLPRSRICASDRRSCEQNKARHFGTSPSRLPRDHRQRDAGVVHAIGVTFGAAAKGGATKWT